MSLAELSQLQILVSNATTPRDVFGDSVARFEVLEPEYLRLTRIANPERFRGDASAQGAARWILTRLYDLHQEALNALAATGVEIVDPIGDSGESSGGAMSAGVSPGPGPGQAAAAENTFRITTPRGAYQAAGVLAGGELSTVYRGRCTAGAGLGQKLAIKVAYETTDNDLLLDEVRTLRLFEVAQSPQRKHLPSLIDQFQTHDGRVGTVLRFVDGYTLNAIRERYPQGIPPQHSVWILRRLLSLLGFAHSQGIIHGNIEPAHILVQPADHNVVLIDWSYSIIEPARTGQHFKVYNPEYSAKEVAERKPPLPAADLYSVGKCMIMVLGGDIAADTLPPAVDDRLARFLQFLVRQSPLQRAQDAWEMYEKLKALREDIFGPHQFLKFEM